MRPMKRSRRGSELGASMVELAMVLPLFVLMVFGIMEASWPLRSSMTPIMGSRLNR